MAMQNNASASFPEQRLYQGGRDIGEIGQQGGGFSPPMHQHSHFQQVPQGTQMGVSSAEFAGNQLYQANPSHGSGFNMQRNINQGFLANSGANINRWDTPPPTTAVTSNQITAQGGVATSNQIAAQGGVTGYSVNFDPNHLHLLIQQQRQQQMLLSTIIQNMQVNEQNAIKREEVLKVELLKSKNETMRLQQKILDLEAASRSGDRWQQSEREQRGALKGEAARGHQKGQKEKHRHGAEGAGEMKKNYYPPPDPLTESADTPNVNAYIKRVAELDDAKINNKSLALEGAKVRIVEHYGTDILLAEQKIIAHAVAADFWCSKGAAKEIRKSVGELPKEDKEQKEVGDIVPQKVPEGRYLWNKDNKSGVKIAVKPKVVLHVVTKVNSPDKLHKGPEPFLRDVKIAFQKMAEFIQEQKMEEIGMTYMCSGIDRLHRLWVMDLLYNELKDVPVTVHLYNKYKSKRWDNCGQLFAPLSSPGSVSDVPGESMNLPRSDQQCDSEVGGSEGQQSQVVMEEVPVSYANGKKFVGQAAQSAQEVPMKRQEPIHTRSHTATKSSEG